MESGLALLEASKKRLEISLSLAVKRRGFILANAMEKGCIKMEKEDGKSTETIFSYYLGNDQNDYERRFL